MWLNSHSCTRVYFFYENPTKILSDITAVFAQLKMLLENNEFDVAVFIMTHYQASYQYHHLNLYLFSLFFRLFVVDFLAFRDEFVVSSNSTISDLVEFEFISIFFFFHCLWSLSLTISMVLSWKPWSNQFIHRSKWQRHKE